MRPLLTLILACPVLAQQTIHLTLDQAIETGLRQNPAVATAQRAVDEGDARIKQARADYFPQFGFNGIAKAGLSGATNALGQLGLPNSPFYRNFAEAATGYQNVWDFGRREHRTALERRRRYALEADLRATEASVILQVQQTYYGVLKAQRLSIATAEVVKSQETVLRQAQAFYEGQIRSRVDLELARAGLARAQLQLLEAQSTVRLASTELGRVMGSSQVITYTLEEPSPELPKPEPPEPLIEEAYRIRPERTSMQAERSAAEEALELARSQRKPLLGMTFSGGWARVTDVMASQLMAGGAGLILPLFTGGRLEGQIEEADAALRLTESRMEDLKLQVAEEVRSADIRLRNALAALPLLRIQADSARQEVRLATERYNERLGSIVELNQALSNLAESLAGETIGLYQVKLAESELRRAVGRR
jgi:outer membrane protein TolC